MTKKLLKTIIFVILAGFILWAGNVFADDGTQTGMLNVATDSTGNSYSLGKAMQEKFLDVINCTPLSAKLAAFTRNCFFCPLFKILFMASASISVASFDSLAEPFQMLLAIGLILYIAFLTLRQVSAFTKQDASKYISELLVVSFKVLVVWLLLGHGPQMYRLFLEPVLSAGMEVGTSFLSASSSEKVTHIESCNARPMETNRAFYSDALEQKVDCFLRTVGEETAISHVIGSSMTCVGLEKIKFGMIFGGLLIMFFAWLISIAFAFYLIDSIIRLGIVGAILPFLLAAWPFKITSGYASKGWSMFLNAFFVFVFLGLIVAIVVELLASAATGGDQNSEEILAYIQNDDVNGLASKMSIGAAGFLFLGICGLFGFKLCKEAASLAAEMGTSGGTPIGSKIGGLAVNAAKVGGKKALKGAGGAVKLAAHIIPTGNGESLASSTNKLRDRISSGVHRFTKKLTSPLTPEGRIGGRNGDGDDQQQPSLEDNQNPTMPVGGGNGGPNGGGNGGPTGGGNGGPSGGSNGGPNGGGNDGSGDGGSNNNESKQPTTPETEVNNAVNTHENHAPGGNGESVGGKQNLEEIARNAAEAAASRVASHNTQSSEDTPLQHSQMKEGTVYGENGKIQSVTNRDVDGNLVKTTYDNDGKISSMITEDKNGNREWQKYDKQENVIESGNIKMATAGGKSYVASQRIVKDGIELSQSYNANGKLQTEVLQKVGEDGKPAEMIRFREYNQDGKLVTNISGKKANKRAEANNRAQARAQKQQNASKAQPTQEQSAAQPQQPAQPKPTQEQSAAQPQQPAQPKPAQEQSVAQPQQPAQPKPAQEQPAAQPQQPAQPNNTSPNEANNKTFDRLQEGVSKYENGNIMSEAVKHADGTITRVLYAENGNIYNIAEEDQKGNRKWQCYDENRNTTEHGTRTINDDGSITYRIYGNNDRMISETLERTDGTAVQTMYDSNGTAYMKIDTAGNVSYNKGDAQQSAADGQLKPEESSNMEQTRKLDTIDILMDDLLKNDKKDNSLSGGKDDDAEANKLKLKEMEVLVGDLMKVAGAMDSNAGAAVSLANLSLDVIKEELRNRGIKIPNE